MIKEKIAKPLLKDDAVKRIFTAPRCQEYLLRIISEATNIPLEDVKKGFKLIPNEISVNKNIKNSQTDLISENKENYINIEINYKKSKASENKNLTYIGQLMLRQTKKESRKDYQNMKKIIQININNYDVLGVNKFVYHSNIREKEYNLKRSELIEIIDINIDYLSKISYNEIEKERKNSLKKMLYIFVCDDEEVLKGIYEGDRVMEKVREEIEDLTHELDKYLYYDKEELDKAAEEEAIERSMQEGYEKGMQKGIEEGIEQGIKQGIEQGIRQEKNNIVIEMLKKNEKLDYISQITGLSIKKIKEIQKDYA